MICGCGFGPKGSRHREERQGCSPRVSVGCYPVRVQKGNAGCDDATADGRRCPQAEQAFDEDFRTLAEVQIKAPHAEVIFVAQFDDEMLRGWMEVIQRGAYEFLPKPLDREELKHHLLRATEKHHPVDPRKRLYATSTHSASAAGT